MEAVERFRIVDPNFTALTYQTTIDTHAFDISGAIDARPRRHAQAGLPEE